MLERARIQLDAFQSCDRTAQVRDSLRDFCRCRIVIDRCGLCGFDRCLQGLKAFCRVVPIEVAVCGFDQCVQLCLGDDLPQLLCCLGHRFVCSLQRICRCVFTGKQFFRCGNCVFQCLHLARTDIVHVGQDVFLDEVDRRLHVCP